MDVVAKFRHPHGTKLRVIKGDARQCPVDIAFFGRNKNLRSDLARAAGIDFVDLGGLYEGSSLLDMRHLQGAWKRAVSIQYRPRKVDPFSPARRDGYCHLQNLRDRIGNLMWHCRYEFQAETVLFMALSCRNPRVNSLAIVAAILGTLAFPSWPWFPPLKEILLVDRTDPSLFISALRNEGDCLLRSGFGHYKFPMELDAAVPRLQNDSKAAG